MKLFDSAVSNFVKQVGNSWLSLRHLDASAVRLTQGWVSQTVKKYREQGVTALQWRKPCGAPTRFTPDQLRQLNWLKNSTKALDIMDLQAQFGPDHASMESLKNALRSATIHLKLAVF
jgi:hypothetical protein